MHLCYAMPNKDPRPSQEREREGGGGGGGGHNTHKRCLNFLMLMDIVTSYSPAGILSMFHCH